jgi:hypothetical protein
MVSIWGVFREIRGNLGRVSGKFPGNPGKFPGNFSETDFGRPGGKTLETSVKNVALGNFREIFREIF